MERERGRTVPLPCCSTATRSCDGAAQTVGRGGERASYERTIPMGQPEAFTRIVLEFLRRMDPEQ